MTRLIWLLFALLVSLFIMAPLLAATYQAEGEGVKVVVYDEPCALKEITNLPKKATWTEKGKTTEGCGGIHPMGVVMLYFLDRTVVLIPVQNFVRVSGA